MIAILFISIFFAVFVLFGTIIYVLTIDETPKKYSKNNYYTVNKEKSEIFGQDNCDIDYQEPESVDMFDDDPIQDGKKAGSWRKITKL